MVLKMWDRLTKPWQICFEEAWDAYCSGSIPIGAVLVDRHGEILYRGRSRQSETNAPTKQVCASRLAHAEINVLLQVASTQSDDLKDYMVYTTTEPCVLCFGAIVMSGVRSIRYAASDPVAGGTNLNDSANTFIKSRNMDVQKAENYVGEIQRVLRTDHVLRTMGEDRINRFLHQYRIDYPKAVDIGIRWHTSNKLQSSMKKQLPISIIINEIGEELHAKENDA
jgi:tRNA(adenine34) deaminase